MRNTSYLCSWKITQNIFIGARVGGIGLGIYGMVGVFILVFIFGMHPGKVPIDVMLDESLDPKNMLVSNKYIK